MQQLGNIFNRVATQVLPSRVEGDKQAAKPEKAISPPKNEKLPKEPSKFTAVSVFNGIKNIIARFDAWPYKLGEGNGELNKDLQQPVKETNSLGRVGFGALKVIKDALLMAPRIGSSVIGGALSLGVLTGAVAAAPFSREWRGKLLAYGGTLGALSLAGIGSAGVRLIGSASDLAHPLTKKDLTISMLDKLSQKFLTTTVMATTERARAWSRAPAVLITSNPSKFENSTFDSLGPDEPALPAASSSSAKRKKSEDEMLKMNETVKKAISLLPAIGGSLFIQPATSQNTEQ